MSGTVLQLEDLISPDQLGCSIANQWVEWNTKRQAKMKEWQEVRQYIYATDTRHTTNAKLPWSNSTTLPKLTQISDNLHANYVASMFPKRKWLNWEGVSKKDESKKKTEAIKDYMMWAVSQREFKQEVNKLVLDYIDYGNCFATVEWVDKSVQNNYGIKSGYVGPRIVRLSPLDIVFNPVASSFSETPKIIRSLVTLGEAKELLSRMTATEVDKEIAQEVFDYALQVRNTANGITELHDKNQQFMVDGFDTYQSYLKSDYVELLTFYGDLYDRENNKLLKNHIIVVIDRHKVAVKREFPYPVAEIPIFHAGWRVRQDNLWAMGPLDNLVGLQYRLDHVENMKSDIFDLVTYPVLKIKGTGSVGDFDWGPMERIYVDTDGDVEMLAPDVNVLQANIEIAAIETRMEEMAGSPKEAMGFRTPGEKTAYEVQRLENAASRIFQNKISYFEEQMIEPLLNSMLVYAKQNLQDTSIRSIDDEYGIVDFKTITQSDLSANGRIKPVAARHFAEQAELIQNITNFSQSPFGQDPEVMQHISSIKLAELMEDVLNVSEYELVIPYVRISERAESQRLSQTAEEGLMNEMMTPSGLTPDDYTEGSIDEEAVAAQQPVAEEQIA